MATPIYFFPRVPIKELILNDRLNAARLAKYDLAEILGDLTAQQVSKQDLTGAGPGEASGAMITVNPGGKAPQRMGYVPQFQTWTKVRIEPELWIGVDKEYPPGPQDLARPRLIPGHNVPLADGHDYVIPVIRGVRGDTGLPEDMFRGPDGEFAREIKPAYRQLWEDTQPVWDFLYGDAGAAEPGSMEYPDVLDLAVRFVGINYRYGAAEQAVLRLIDSTADTWQAVFHAVVDGPFLEMAIEAQKKSESQPAADTPSSGPGPPDASPSTDPAAPNST